MDPNASTPGSAPPAQNGAPPSQVSAAAAVPALSPEAQVQPAYQPQQPLSAQQAGTPPEQGSPGPAGLARYLAQKGHGQFASDDEAYAALEEMSAQFEQSQQFVQQFAPHADEFHRWRSEQAAKPAAPAQPEKPKWAAPEWDPEWASYLREDDQGRYVGATPWVPKEIVQKANAYRKYQQEQAERLIREPENVVWERLEEKIQAAADARIKLWHEQQQQASVEQQQQRQYDQFIAEHGPKLLQPDGRTLTPAGAAFAQYATQMRESGMTNPAMIQSFALRMVEQDLAVGKITALAGVPAQPAVGAPPNGSTQPAPAAERPRGPDGRFLSPTAAEQNEQLLSAYSQPQGRNRLGDQGLSAQPDATVQSALRGEPSRRRPTIEQIADDAFAAKGLI
jgi:hypothetical protein